MGTYRRGKRNEKNAGSLRRIKIDKRKKMTIFYMTTLTMYLNGHEMKLETREVLRKISSFQKKQMREEKATIITQTTITQSIHPNQQHRKNWICCWVEVKP